MDCTSIELHYDGNNVGRLMAKTALYSYKCSFHNASVDSKSTYTLKGRYAHHHYHMFKQQVPYAPLAPGTKKTQRSHNAQSHTT